MLDENGTTGKGGNEIDLALVKEVVLLTGEAGVGLLLDDKHNIAGENTRRLVTLTAEFDLGTALNTTVDVDVEDLAIDDGLLAVALLAAILLLNHLAFAIAVRANSLEALDHGTHLPHHDLGTLTLAASTPPDGALLAAAAVALGAENRALEGQLGDLSAVDVLERYVMGVMNSLCLRGRTLLVHTAEHTTETAAEAAAAEELSEQVLGSHAATGTSTTFKASLAILIVDGAFLGVGKDFVCVRDLLELLLGSRVVGVLVCKVRLSARYSVAQVARMAGHTWVVLEGTGLVCLLQLRLGGIWADLFPRVSPPPLSGWRCR